MRFKLADPADLTPAWLTDALQSTGHDVVVSACRSEAVGTGQMAHNERYKLTYAGDAGDAPVSVVIKSSRRLSKTASKPSAESERADGSEPSADETTASAGLAAAGEARVSVSF